MLKLRLIIAGMIAWLFLLYNIERIDGGVNIATFVYFLSAGLAIATVTWHRLTSIWVLVLFVASLAVLLSLKSLWGYGILGASLTNTLTEIGCLGFTLYVARQASSVIRKFEQGAVDVMTMQLQNSPATLDAGQGEMYREIRRARHFQRPLTLVAITPTETSFELAANRMVEEVQRETITKYINGKISAILSEASSGLGTVALKENEHFFLMLPEMDRERSEQTVSTICERVERELGLKLTIGRAGFPEEEITLVGLMDRAVADMDFMEELSHTLENENTTVSETEHDSNQRKSSRDENDPSASVRSASPFPDASAE